MLRRICWLLLILTAGVGCGALDEFEEVIVDEALLPRQTSVGPFSPNFGGQLNDLDLSTAREFRNNDVSPDDVDAIFIRSIVVETDGGSEELSQMDLYLSRVEYYIEAEGLPRVRLGELTEIPSATSARIPLDDRDRNFKSYAVSPRMRIGVDVELSQVPFVNVTLRTRVTLLVDIDLLGS